MKGVLHVVQKEITKIINVIHANQHFSFIVIKQKIMEAFLDHVMIVVRIMVVINQTRKIQKIWKKCVLVSKIAKLAKIKIYVMNAGELGYYLLKEQAVIKPVIIV